MRLPNQYGSVFKLSGKRRKPYAVRILTGYHDSGSGIYKYLGYFEKAADAYDFLAKYNSGLVTPQNCLISSLLFKQVFDSWITEHEKYKSVSQKTHESYVCAYNQLSDLHNRIFASLRLEDLQAQVDRLAGMSESTISKPITLLHHMYTYALRHDIADKDYSKYIIRVSPREKQQSHSAFSHKEIAILWEDNSFAAQVTLIYIYTGFRANELLTLPLSNVNLKERYLQGGSKTAAGKDRIVPIHNKILPLVRKFFKSGKEYLIEENNASITYPHFVKYLFTPLMEKYKMKHTMHDTRHTCATLLKEYGCEDFYRKLIMGHHIEDLTDRVYTHVTIQRLLLEVNKVEI